MRKWERLRFEEGLMVERPEGLQVKEATESETTDEMSLKGGHLC